MSLSSGDWIPLGIEVGVSMLEKGRNSERQSAYKEPMGKVKRSK
jgi:hypothetical protein